MSPAPAGQKKPATAQKPARRFFSFISPPVEAIADDAKEEVRRKRLARVLTLQSLALLGLTGTLILALPFFQPIYHYAAVNPAKQFTPLAPLLLPNLTNHAITSWAATSVTEIMTIGFGDFEARLLRQRKRFTPDGWDAFIHGFLSQKIDESFRQHQLVLTTVPADAPVITAQGENEKHIYEWHVQMPVIMTYATNNNVTRPERAVVDITIVRVPYEQNPSGIAIDTWKQMKK